MVSSIRYDLERTGLLTDCGHKTEARMFSKFAVLARRYPLVPSMMTYSVLYPSANLLQQYAFRENTKVTGVDWREVSRLVTVLWTPGPVPHETVLSDT